MVALFCDLLAAKKRVTMARNLGKRLVYCITLLIREWRLRIAGSREILVTRLVVLSGGLLSSCGTPLTN